MDDSKFNNPTGFEKMLFEGVVRSFFIGQNYYDQSGYMRTEPAPMGMVTAQVVQKLTPELVKAILTQINVDKLAEDIRAKLDMKAIKKQVTDKVKTELMKKLS